MLTPDNLDSYLAASAALDNSRAIYTIESRKTGTRYTYRVTAPRDMRGQHQPAILWVSLLTGPNNDVDYTYIGLLSYVDRVTGYGYRHGGDRIGPNAPGVQAIRWALRNRHHTRLAWYSDGRCSRCRRTLTTPESVTYGIGPTCREYLGIP